MIARRAHAKINLTLEILGKRPDGYHEIASILQTVSLHDSLTFEEADALELRVEGAAPAGEHNLVWRAARMLRERGGLSRGASVTLVKRIPAAAGLGGGSSDAAAALQGLNALWRLGARRDDLADIAAAISSDAPFFLTGGAARVGGRGERVTPLPSPKGLEWAVILNPGFHLPNKTAAMFARVGADNYTNGGLTRKLAARLSGGGDLPAQFLFNAFDDLAFEAFPDMPRCVTAFRALGATEARLCGAGPSLYALAPDRPRATAVSLLLQRLHGWESHAVSMVGRDALSLDPEAP